MTFFIRILALGIGKLSRLFGLGAGTSMPGKIALKLKPNIAAKLAEGMEIVLISGTNGKTTTANLLAQIFGNNKKQVDEKQVDEKQVVSNSEGANLMSGITTTLLKQKRASNSEISKIAIFEVDEAILPKASKTLRPRLIILNNLSRDQLDRYGEIEKLISSWQSFFSADLGANIKILANADDPLIVSAVENLPEESVSFFGIDNLDVQRSKPLLSDAHACRKCGSPLSYEFYSVGHSGKWNCKNCNWLRPALNFGATQIQLESVEGVQLVLNHDSNQIKLKAPLPGLHNVYNITAASSAALLLGVPAADIVATLSDVPRHFGRFEEVKMEDKELLLILAKNPISVNENLITLTSKGSEKLHILSILNDRTADGKDISWIWDVDYELIIDRIASVTTSGSRAAEMALRFQYGGLDKDKISINPDLNSALANSLQNLNGERLIVLLTYTALLDFRKFLHKQKIIQPYWKKNR